MAATPGDILIVQTGYDPLWRINADGSTVTYKDALNVPDPNEQEITTVMQTTEEWITVGTSGSAYSATKVIARRDPDTAAFVEWIDLPALADPRFTSGSQQFFEGHRLRDGRLVLVDDFTAVYDSSSTLLGWGSIAVISADLTTVQSITGPFELTGGLNDPWVWWDSGSNRANPLAVTAENKLLAMLVPSADSFPAQFQEIDLDTGTIGPVLNTVADPNQVFDLAVDWVSGRFAVGLHSAGTLLSINIYSASGTLFDQLVPSSNGGDCWDPLAVQSSGCLAFGPDGLLYFATADYTYVSPYGSLRNGLNGSIWKINLDTGDGARSNFAPWVRGFDDISVPATTWGINWNQGIFPQQTRMWIYQPSGLPNLGATFDQESVSFTRNNYG